MEKFTFIGSLLCSLLPLLTIKKVFYRQAALHPWIFACLVYYPIVRLGILITCSILDSLYPGYIHYAFYIGFLPAFFVFRGGKHTRALANSERDRIYNNRMDIYRSNVLAKIQETILRISPSVLPDFSAFHRTDLQISVAVASILFIRDKTPPFSENECLRVLHYYHKALSTLSNPQFDRNNIILSNNFVNETAKEFDFVGIESLYAYRYIVMNMSDPELYIDERNKYYLEENSSSEGSSLRIKSKNKSKKNPHKKIIVTLSITLVIILVIVVSVWAAITYINQNYDIYEINSFLRRFGL